MEIYAEILWSLIKNIFAFVLEKHHYAIKNNHDYDKSLNYVIYSKYIDNIE